MSNPYTGEVSILIGGTPRTMVFDWRALAKIHAECGEDAVTNMFRASEVFRQSPDKIAKMIHAGLLRHHPDVTIEAILDGAPPYAQAVELVSKGLTFAYFGPNSPADEAKGEDSAGDDSKKN